MSNVKKSAIRKRVCPYCDGIMPLGKAFCGKTCKELYFEDLKIVFSPKFIKATCKSYGHCKKSIEEAVQKVSIFHGFNFDLALKKFYRSTDEIGYTFAWTEKQSN